MKKYLYILLSALVPMSAVAYTLNRVNVLHLWLASRISQDNRHDELDCLYRTMGYSYKHKRYQQRSFGRSYKMVETRQHQL